MFGRKNINENFYETFPIVKKYIDEGLLVELYTTDTYIVCKLANHGYGVIPKVGRKGDQVVMAWSTEEFIRGLLEYGPELLYRRFDDISKKDQSYIGNTTYVICEENIPSLRKRMEELRVNGPSEFLNPAFEAELLRLNNQKNNGN